MARVHLIEHVGGNQWLAQYGFVEKREAALQFPTAQDADLYLQDNPQLKVAGHKRVTAELEAPTGRFAGQADTEYSPWGRP
jgi:hypothetical protein